MTGVEEKEKGLLHATGSNPSVATALDEVKKEKKKKEDCLFCRLTGFAAFTGGGAYVISQSLQGYKEAMEKREGEKSGFGNSKTKEISSARIGWGRAAFKFLSQSSPVLDRAFGVIFGSALIGLGVYRLFVRFDNEVD
eukprot:Nk52_evm21s2273 gene=Nk52_evmTU21s2273